MVWDGEKTKPNKANLFRILYVVCRMSWFEKTKPILKWLNWCKVLYERVL